MAVLHVPLTSLLLLATDQESYEKAYFLTKNIEDNSGGKKSGEWAIIINFLTARVVAAPQMIYNQFPPFFLCSPLPSGTWRTLGLPIP